MNRLYKRLLFSSIIISLFMNSCIDQGHVVGFQWVILIVIFLLIGVLFKACDNIFFNNEKTHINYKDGFKVGILGSILWLIFFVGYISLLPDKTMANPENKPTLLFILFLFSAVSYTFFGKFIWKYSWIKSLQIVIAIPIILCLIFNLFLVILI